MVPESDRQVLGAKGAGHQRTRAFRAARPRAAGSEGRLRSGARRVSEEIGGVRNGINSQSPTRERGMVPSLTRRALQSSPYCFGFSVVVGFGEIGLLSVVLTVVV